MFLSKIISLVISALLIGSLITGVLEVNFHPEKLAAVTGGRLDSIPGGEIIASLGTQAVKIQRQLDLFFASDADARLEKSISYVEDDLAATQAAIDNGEAMIIVRKAGLLSSSFDLVKKHSEGASADTLATLKDRVGKVGEQTRSILATLDKVQDEYAAQQEKIAAAKEALTHKVKNLAPPPGEEGEVAGTKTE